jgi:Rrf2 family protein
MFSMTQEYALRAMTQLAREAPASATTAHLAESVRIPGAYLAKVMQQLRRAKLITSRRGVGGGISLARPAKRISLLDVIEAVDPWKRGNGKAGKTPLDRKLKQMLDQVQKAAATTSLADVAT